MLARIAEREIARRVEAREERGSIVLRAAPYGAMAAPLAPMAATPAPAPAPVAEAAPEPARAASEPAAAAPTVENQALAEVDAPAAAPVQTPAPTAEPVQASALPAATPEAAPEEDAWEDVIPESQPAPASAMARPTPVPHPDPDSVAAKLQRIRDVVSKSAIAAPQTYSEDEHADSFLSETARSIQSALDSEDQADFDEDEDDSDEIAALLSRLSQEDTIEWPVETPAAEEVADVAEHEAEPAPADLPATQDDLANPVTQDEIATDIAETYISNDEPAEAVTLATDDDVAEASQADSAPNDPAFPVSRVITIKRTKPDAAPVASDSAAAQDSATDAPTPAAQEDEIVASDLPPDSDLSPEDEEALRLELAAVEAELQRTPKTQDSPTALDVDDIRAASTAATVTQDDQPIEDQLAALAADVEKERAEDVRAEDDLAEDDLYEDELTENDSIAAALAQDDLDEDGTEEDDFTSLFADDDADEEAALLADAEDDAAARDDGRGRLVQTKAEDDMQRLMAKAESARTEPENASRRSAIAHLRAAVAAINAEKSAGIQPAKANPTDAFRDDLADVVRPRRPVGDSGTATPRPSEQRPAPLKLVAEQRIDLPQGDADPVRPRRVSIAGLRSEPATMDAASSANELADSGFSDFAQKMGATTLPELMEAAAAYLAHIEDRNAFSRAQLMTKARQATDGDFNREDGLRAFGQLLRQGKIAKLRGGAFAATDDIGFRPDNRRVG